MSVNDEMDFVLEKMKNQLFSSDVMDEVLLTDYMRGLQIKLQLLQAEETRMKFEKESELREKDFQLREKELENAGRISPAHVFGLIGDIIKTAAAFAGYGLLLNAQNNFEQNDSYSLSASKDLGRQFHTLLKR